MCRKTHTATLTPGGLAVDGVEIGAAKIIVMARPSAKMATCPECGAVSGRIHSRYRRRLIDLPAHGRIVEINVETRRFRCVGTGCRRRIFVQRLGDAVALPSARRTMRMDGIVHRLGLALGGRPGHNLASRLAIPVSKDTLLRTVRRRAARPREPLRAVGIDDWAWRKGCQYGTVICDLERRRIVALLPDRAGGTSAAWLRDHPSIEFIARDRGASYGDAASKGAPQAVQIADRWHLFENASASFLDVVRQNMHAIRKSSATDDIDPALLSCAERKRWENFQHRKKTVDAVLRLLEQGTPLKQITRRLNLARQTVRRIARGGGLEVFRSRVSILEPYAETLDALWTGGCRNGAELWRRLRIRGFQGSLRVVAEWATRRRLDESSNPAGRVRKTPSARKIARLMTIERDQVPRDHVSMMANIAYNVPPLFEARDLVDRFHEIMRQQKAADLDPWIVAAIASPLSSFAKGIIADRDAVQAAIIQPWSNGQTEGQITKLKLVKRQMYGRAKIDLLEARVIGTA